MKKLYHFTFVWLCSSIVFGLNAIEPDVSKCETFKDAFYHLESTISYPVTHFDLRITKANMLLHSDKICREFKGLQNVQGGEYKINSDYSKIICDVYLDASYGSCYEVIGDEIFYSNNFFYYPLGSNLTERLINVKNIYENIRDLAKKHIIHLICDTNIEVIMHGIFEKHENGKIEKTQETMAKWENGEAIYYEGFMKNL